MQSTPPSWAISTSSASLYRVATLIPATACRRARTSGRRGGTTPEARYDSRGLNWLERVHARWRRPVALTGGPPPVAAGAAGGGRGRVTGGRLRVFRRAAAQLERVLGFCGAGHPAGDPFALEWRPRLQAAFRAAAVNDSHNNTRTRSAHRVYSRGAVGALTGVGVTAVHVADACSSPWRPCARHCADDIGEAAEDDEYATGGL